MTSFHYETLLKTFLLVCDIPDATYRVQSYWISIQTRERVKVTGTQNTIQSIALQRGLQHWWWKNKSMQTRIISTDCSYTIMWRPLFTSFLTALPVAAKHKVKYDRVEKKRTRREWSQRSRFLSNLGPKRTSKSMERTIEASAVLEWQHQQKRWSERNAKAWAQKALK